MNWLDEVRAPMEPKRGRGRPRKALDMSVVASDLGTEQAARLLGVSKDTVIARRKELGLPVRRRGQRGPDRQKRRPGSGLWARSDRDA